MTALKRKIEQSRVSISSFPMLSVLAAAHARETGAALRSLFNTLADVKTEACAVVRCGRFLRGLPTPAALGLVSVDGVPDAAAIHLDAALTSHVVDLSQGGDPSAEHAHPHDFGSSIDMVLCARFADAVLRAFNEAVRSVCKGETIGRMVCERFETAPQMASIAPERSELLIVNQRVEVGDAPRAGFLELALPLSVVDPIKIHLTRHFGSPSSVNSDLWERHLRDNLMRSRIGVDAVLDVQQLPLGGVLALREGDVLPLRAGAMDDLQLVIEHGGGRVALASCRLGARDPRKAVKLREDPGPEVLRLLRVSEGGAAK